MAKTYSDKLKDPRWQKKRLKILERDGWECQACFDKENTLHVHHKKYTNNPWNAPDKDLITLCEGCHKQESTFNKSEEYWKLWQECSNELGITGIELINTIIALKHMGDTYSIRTLTRQIMNIKEKKLFVRSIKITTKKNAPN